MSDSGQETTRTGYTSEIPLPEFLQGFHGDLLQAFPAWENELTLMMDAVGLPLALSLAVRAPNRNRNLVLNICATELDRSVRIDFNGASEEFNGSFEAVRYIGFIVNEEIVCLSRFLNSEFDSAWMTEPGNAMRLIAAVDNKPSGCMSFLNPQKEELLQVSSWTGRMDDMEHFRSG